MAEQDLGHGSATAIDFGTIKLSHEVICQDNGVLAGEGHETLLRLPVDQGDPLHLRSGQRARGHSLQLGHLGARNRSHDQLLVTQEGPGRTACSEYGFGVSPLVTDDLVCRRRPAGPRLSAFRRLRRRSPSSAIRSATFFEGDAQSFRIVTQLAVRSTHPGLDLTAQTLNGLLKYPWKRWSPDPLGGKRKRKWGYYAEDAETYEFVRKGWPADSKDQIAERCLEAEIMDWADDLTYAVHDVDDFFRAGLIPLNRLVDKKDNELKRLAGLLESARVEDPESFPNMTVEELVEATREAISRHRLLPGPYEHTKASRAAMRQSGSQLITDYLDDFTLADHLSSGKVELKIGERAKREVEALKMLAVVYVIRRPSLAVVQEGQKRVVMSLFERYYEASGSDEKSKDGIRLFPPGAREKLRMEGGDSRARIVMDLISGLTETAAIELHNRLSGGWTASALDATATIG